MFRCMILAIRVKLIYCRNNVFDIGELPNNRKIINPIRSIIFFFIRIKK